MILRRSTFFPLATIALFTACGDDPVGPQGGGDQREIKAQPSFSTDVNEIFQRRGCASGACHGAAGGQAGLVLTASATANWANLVDVPSSQDSNAPPRDLVEPNDAQNSYLVVKLEDRQPVGARMPLGGSPLDNIDLTNIRNWINNGAPAN